MLGFYFLFSCQKVIDFYQDFGHNSHNYFSDLVYTKKAYFFFLFLLGQEVHLIWRALLLSVSELFYNQRNYTPSSCHSEFLPLALDVPVSKDGLSTWFHRILYVKCFIWKIVSPAGICPMQFSETVTCVSEWRWQMHRWREDTGGRTRPSEGLVEPETC